MNAEEKIKLNFLAESLKAHYKGVKYVDIGYKWKNYTLTPLICLRLYVEQKKERKQMEQTEADQIIPTKLEGYTTDILVENTEIHNGRDKKYEPLLAGIKIMNGQHNWGTLGCLAYDNQSGKKLILSAAHVLGTVNSKVYQPDDKSLMNEIGTVTKSEWRSDRDCAVAELNSHRRLLTTIMDNNNRKMKAIIGICAPTIGQVVFKSGAATGVTVGIIEGLDSMGGFTITRHFNKRLSPPLQPLCTLGDSGAIWIDIKTHFAVGLHYKGTPPSELIQQQYAQNIEDVQNWLSIKVYK